MNTDNTDSSETTGNTAVARTQVEYKKQIKKHYEAVKSFIHDGVLNEPSNGNFRDVCQRLLLDGLSKEDDRVFRNFFDAAQTDKLKDKIDAGIEKFRKVANFLDGTSQNTDIKNLNLIAVLIDFNARPYPEFLKYGVQNPPKSQDIKADSTTKDDTEEVVAVKALRRKGMVIIGAVAAVLMAIAILYSAFFQKPSFMQWQTDHYEEAATAEDVKLGALVYPMNPAEFPMKRVRVYDSTTFFIKGVPQYWCIQDNGYVFFDRPGKYPLDYEKELRPVSSYIAQKVHDGTIKIDY